MKQFSLRGASRSTVDLDVTLRQEELSACHSVISYANNSPTLQLTLTLSYCYVSEKKEPDEFLFVTCGDRSFCVITF